MSDIRIGIDIQLVGESKKTIESLSTLTKSLRDISKATKIASSGFKGLKASGVKIGDEIIEISNSFSNFIDELDAKGVKLDTLSGQVKEVNKVLAAYRTQNALAAMQTRQHTQALVEFSYTGDTSKESLDRVTAALDYFNAEGKSSAEVLNLLNKGFRSAGMTAIPDSLFRTIRQYNQDMTGAVLTARDFSEALTVQTPEMKQLSAAFKKGVQHARDIARAQSAVTERSMEVSRMFRDATAAMGPMGIATTRVAQSFFWAGLGMMFTVMSLSRVEGKMLAVQSAQLGIMNANLRLVDAQKSLNDMEQRGVTTGYDYVRALYNVRSAQLGVTQSEQQVKSAVWQSQMAWMMLAFGTFPTVIRTITDLINNTILLASAQAVQGGATFAQIAAQYGLIVALQETTVSLFGVEMATWGVVAAIGALTIAIPIIVGLIARMRAMDTAKKSIASTTTELEKLHATLTEPHSPPLYESFAIMSDNMEKALRTGRRLSRVDPLKSMNTDLAKGAGVPRLGNINTGGYYGGGYSRNVTINLNGPISMRSEEDIRSLAREIKRLDLRSYQKSGGRVV